MSVCRSVDLHIAIYLSASLPPTVQHGEMFPTSSVSCTAMSRQQLRALACPCASQLGSALDGHPPTSHSLMQNAAASSAKSEQPTRRSAGHLRDTTTQSSEGRREPTRWPDYSSLWDSRCLQQHSFWVKLRHHPPQLPMARQTVQSWDTFIAQVADARLPPALFLPDSAYPQQDTARAAVLNADFTVAEVVSQLPKLHNGRSAGHADLPAEFLRYAQQPPQPNQPLPPHLLAPTLAGALHDHDDHRQRAQLCQPCPRHAMPQARQKG